MCDFTFAQIAGRPASLIAARHRWTQMVAKVQAALEAAGSSVAQLVQVRVYVTDIAPPARAVVLVPLLHYGFLIEVEAVGVVGLLQN